MPLHSRVCVQKVLWPAIELVDPISMGFIWYSLVLRDAEAEMSLAYRFSGFGLKWK